MFHKVYDNLIPQSLVKEFAEEIQNPELRWIQPNNQFEKPFTFSNPLIAEMPRSLYDIDNSHNMWAILQKILKSVSRASGIDISSCSYGKATTILKNTHFNSECYLAPHCDIDKVEYSDQQSRAISLIYYPLDSDGKTKIFDTFLCVSNTFDERMQAIDTARCMDEIQARKGRCVIYPAGLLTSSTAPIESENFISISGVCAVKRGLDPKINAMPMAA